MNIFVFEWKEEIIFLIMGIFIVEPEMINQYTIIKFLEFIFTLIRLQNE